MDFFLRHGCDRFGDAGIDVEERNEIGRFEEITNGFFRAGEFESVSSGLGPHVGENEFSQADAIDGIDSCEIDDHAVSGGQDLGDHGCECLRLAVEEDSALAVQDHGAAEGASFQTELEAILVSSSWAGGDARERSVRDGRFSLHDFTVDREAREWVAGR